MESQPISLLHKENLIMNIQFFYFVMCKQFLVVGILQQSDMKRFVHMTGNILYVTNITGADLTILG